MTIHLPGLKSSQKPNPSSKCPKSKIKGKTAKPNKPPTQIKGKGAN